MSEDSFLEKVARGPIRLSTSIARALATVVAEMFLVMIDRSGSMAAKCGRMDRLSAAKNAVIAMLDSRLEQDVDDQFALIAFDDRTEVVLGTANSPGDRGIIENAIRSIAIRGGTDLKAPLVAARKILPRNACVHIVMLTDGFGGTRMTRLAKCKMPIGY